MTVFWILGGAFVVLGIYLYFYSRKRSRLIKDIASSRGLSWSDKDDSLLEKELEQAFGFYTPGIVRSFGRIRDIIQKEGIKMFRTTELLDLNPYGTSQNTHFGRIAAYFDAPAGPEMFFLVSPGLEYSNKHPTEAIPTTDRSFVKIKEALDNALPRHHLSVTVMRGKAILYVEPVFGSEKREDVEYLLDLAGKVYAKLWSNDG